MNYSSFPLSKVTEDLEKELDLDFSHDNNAVHEKKLHTIKRVLVVQLKHKVVYQAFLTKKFIVQ